MDDRDDRVEGPADVDDWQVVGDAPVLGAGSRRSVAAASRAGAVTVAAPAVDAEAVRILAALGSGPQRPAATTAAAATAPPDGTAIDWSAPPLAPGAPLSRSRLATTLAVHLGARRELVLQAAAREPRSLAFRVVVHADGRPRPLEVVVPLRRGGFDGRRLRPRLTASADGHRAEAALDDPVAAVDLLCWVLARHGLSLAAFSWEPSVTG